MEDWSGGNSCFDHAREEGGMDMDETQQFRWFLGIDVSKSGDLGPQPEYLESEDA